MKTRKITIGVLQMTSVLNPIENLNSIKEIFYRHPDSKKIDYLFLPECFYSISNGQQPTPFIVKNEQCSHLLSIIALAKELNVNLIGGSVAFAGPNGKLLNRALFIDKNSGNLIDYYDKMHLFQVNMPKNNNILDETKHYTAGKKPTIIGIENEFKIGLSICFDLRFPQLYQHYFAHGCNMLSVCAAFTVPTGKAHWEVLLRARAIENQSYIIASAQWGQHNERIITYGHSMLINPWGQIIDIIPEGVGMIVSEINVDEIEDIRSRMNVIENHSYSS